MGFIARLLGFSDDPETVEVELPKNPIKYRVTPHYHSGDYWCLDYTFNGIKWYRLTRPYDHFRSEPDRHHPVLEDENTLLNLANKFKADPETFHTFIKKQEELYNKLLGVYNARQKARSERQTHII